MAEELTEWQRTAKKALELFGHRNWLVVTDSAYPSQTQKGIQTVVTGAGQVETLAWVIEQMRGLSHVKPLAFVDIELRHLNTDDVPTGLESRADILRTLQGVPMHWALHEQLIALLDEAGAKFQILLLKTTSSIPYSSVFFLLECGYWSGEREAALRARMAATPDTEIVGV